MSIRTGLLTLLLGSALAAATPALAEHRHGGGQGMPGGEPHSGWHDGGPGSGERPAVHTMAPPQGGQGPGQGSGNYVHGGSQTVGRGWPGVPPGRVAPGNTHAFRFSHHNFGQFSAEERSHWGTGRWRHGYHHGHGGWWWVVGGTWYFYPEPIYPYPGYVSDYWYDYYDYGPGSYSDGYDGGDNGGGYWWYYCNDPKGYYPYVRDCRVDWERVPPTPDASGPQNDGGGPQYDDRDDNHAQQGPDDNQDDDEGPPPPPPPR